MLPVFSQETISIPDIGFEEALIDLKFDSNGLNGNILLSDAQYIKNLNINSPLNNEQLPNVNSKIKDLTGIEHFTNLTRLDCSGNEIEKIDLSKNLKLSFLNCRENKIKSLDLSNNPELFSISCDYNQLNSIVLGSKPVLRDLYCNNNQLTSADVSQCTALENLDLSYNNIAEILIDKKTYDKYFEGWHKDSKAQYKEDIDYEIARQIIEKVDKINESIIDTKKTKSSDKDANAKKASQLNSNLSNNNPSNFYQKFKRSVILEYDKLVLNSMHLQNCKQQIEKKYQIDSDLFAQWISQFGKLKIKENLQVAHTSENATDIYNKFQQEVVKEYEASILTPNYILSKKQEIIKKYQIKPEIFDDWINKYGKLTINTQANTKKTLSLDYFKEFKKAMVLEYEKSVLTPTYLKSKKTEIQKKYNLNADELSNWISEFSAIY